MSIMVVDAVGEEYIFGILHELYPIGIILIATVRYDGSFQGHLDG